MKTLAVSSQEFKDNFTESINKAVKVIESTTDYDVLNWDEFHIEVIDRSGDDGKVTDVKISLSSKGFVNCDEILASLSRL